MNLSDNQLKELEELAGLFMEPEEMAFYRLEIILSIFILLYIKREITLSIFPNFR